MTIHFLTVAFLTVCPGRVEAQSEKPRARDLGVPFEGAPGPLNAITDVPAVEVGHTTLISGDSVRTGVTVVLPEGKRAKNQVFAGWFTLNADGEMTGTTWIEESGILEGPVAITNTHSVGTVHQAVIEWSVRNVEGLIWSLPVVAETWDGGLNDINGFHVRPEHVFAAIESARGGAVTVGALVQANYGFRSELRIVGVPVGQEIQELMPEPERPDDGNGSIIVVVA